MRHFHIDIVVTEDEVRIIKEQFRDYVAEADGFTLKIMPDNPDADAPSSELSAVLCQMYFNLIMTITTFNFKGVN